MMLTIFRSLVPYYKKIVKTEEKKYTGPSLEPSSLKYLELIGS
jgi:hypothetical protein